MTQMEAWNIEGSTPPRLRVLREEITKSLEGICDVGGMYAVDNSPFTEGIFDCIPEKSIICYHGTSVEATHEIFLDGKFRKDLSRSGRFGKGIYLSTDIRKAACYALDNFGSDNHQLLICEVKIGRNFKYPYGITDPYNIIAGSSDGYDSLTGEVNKYGKETVIFDSDRILILGSVTLLDIEEDEVTFLL